MKNNPHDIVDVLSYASNNRECMMSNCSNCLRSALSLEDFEGDSENVSDNDGAYAESSIGYYEWKRSLDGKIKKALVTISAEEAIDLFNSQFVTLKQHIYIKQKQVSCYNDIKDNLTNDQLLIHVDYSENYENRQQGEIQSAYFGHTTQHAVISSMFVNKRKNRS